MGYLTPCYHLICSDCKDVHIQNLTPRLTQDHYHNCTYCEQYVRFGLFELRRSGLKAMLDARNKAKGKQAKWDDSTYTGPHTKVKALLEDLKKTAAESASLPADEPPIRSVIFSGWTSYIDLIEHALDENDFRFVRLDGSMSLKARSSVLNAFQSDPDITILLVSIKAGGQGLNFTAASKVYMMEPQFNPGVELQAIDRVHRLGQNRDVDIVHYIMNDSVEVKILNLQKKKIALAEMSMEKKLSKAEEAKKRIEELHDLFK
jgi:SNF2 family DNA or RNA helicase